MFFENLTAHLERVENMKKITMTALKKAVKENLYLKSFKIIESNAKTLIIAGSMLVVEFSIHGSNQQWLSFYVHGCTNHTYCEQLIDIMNTLEGKAQ